MPSRRRVFPGDLDSGQRVNCSVRCTPEWSSWLFNGACGLKMTMSDLVERAVTEYLTRRGYTVPAPDRIPLPPPVDYSPRFPERPSDDRNRS